MARVSITSSIYACTLPTQLNIHIIVSYADYMPLFGYIRVSLCLSSVMYNAFNAKLFRDEPVGPKPYSSPASPIYFLLYMLTMALLILNLFTGTVIVTFQQVGVKAFRESKLDRNQVTCINILCIK